MDFLNISKFIFICYIHKLTTVFYRGKEVSKDTVE